MVGNAQWTPTRYAHNGQVRIAYDTFVGSSGDPLVLVMGLGTSRFWWPDGLCAALADVGFQVLRYDQRDAGESTRMPEVRTTNPFVALTRGTGEAYTAEDMVDDAVAVLDAAAIPGAFVAGHSMGGLLAQRLAIRHPDRVLGLVSGGAVPSDASGLTTWRHLRLRTMVRLARTTFDAGRQGDIDASVALARLIASSTYPADEDAVRTWAQREADSGPRDAKAQSRQIGAPWSGGRLADVVAPTLVVHGEEDPLVKPSAARAIAGAIPGARVRILRGVGHDLPAPSWAEYAREVRALADRTRAASA
ncbi:alpha/beta hydrolase [Cellulosimicrobium sp. Marseille-Q4280]|uniref:alpha/beta fold hydrolase n=1 Tax=Cellulosimicrobium sp. Marseille-Q4280 TaxID=2937992 RepID=UPI00204207E3|nr:alpha/beta hydrolase [Cellulosimicrobium sp. Marseille-Q4280]